MKNMVLLGIFVALLLIAGCCGTTTPPNGGGTTNTQTSGGSGTSTTSSTTGGFVELTNTIASDVIVNKNISEALLQNTEMGAEWQKKNSWGNYTCDGRITSAINMEGPNFLNSRITQDFNLYCPTHITLDVHTFTSIEEAKQVYGGLAGSMKTSSRTKYDLTEIGNEQIGATQGIPFSSGQLFTIIFRRNNIVVALNAVDLSTNVDTHEIENYAIIVDNKLHN